MQTAEEWLLGKLGEYKRKPRQTLKDAETKERLLLKTLLAKYGKDS